MGGQCFFFLFSSRKTQQQMSPLPCCAARDTHVRPRTVHLTLYEKLPKDVLRVKEADCIIRVPLV